MVSKEIMKELEHYFNSETNDEETQEWRDYLNEEEEKIVEKWDKQFNKGMKTLCEELIKKINK